MTEIHGHPSPTMELEGPNPISLKLREQYVAFTQRPVAEINIAGSEMVFVDMVSLHLNMDGTIMRDWI